LRRRTDGTEGAAAGDAAPAPAESSSRAHALALRIMAGSWLVVRLSRSA
jgi:hypothetical protein